MAIRNALDANGNIIGTIELPDSTTEDQWTEALSHYSYVPPALTPTNVVNNALDDAQTFGQALIRQCEVENVLLGITQANMTKPVADYCQNLMVYLDRGSLYAAITELQDLISAGPPSNLAPYITTDRLNSYVTQIQTWLGIPGATSNG